MFLDEGLFYLTVPCLQVRVWFPSLQVDSLIFRFVNFVHVPATSSCDQTLL